MKRISIRKRFADNDGIRGLGGGLFMLWIMESYMDGLDGRCFKADWWDCGRPLDFYDTHAEGPPFWCVDNTKYIDIDRLYHML